VFFAITYILFVIHTFMLNFYMKIKLFFLHHFHIFQYFLVMTSISLI